MLSRFRYFARETWVSLRRNKLMTAAGVITVAVSLCVLGGALLMTRLVDHGTQKWKDGVQFEVFMVTDATTSQVKAVQSQLSGDSDVDHFTYLSKQDAYKEFKRLYSDQPDLVSTITPQDLPESFRVAPRTAELTKEVSLRYRSLPGVDDVNTADKAVKDLLATSRWIRFGFLSIFFALLFASLFLIVNTIRLATYARRREIEVMKLVGASNWFVRIPFLAEGLVQGFIGAGIAFAVVYFLKVRLSSALAGGSGFVQTFFLTTRDAWSIGFLVLVLGAAIGVIASAVGLRRFLDV